MNNLFCKESKRIYRVLAIAPDIKVVTDVRELCDGISTYSLVGHTADGIGVFDGHTGTLITLFFHAYEPWNQDFIFGRKNICDCIEACIEFVEEV